MARAKKSTTTPTDSAQAAATKKSDKYNPYTGYTVSAFLRKAAKFAWRGKIYRTYALSDKELADLAADDKFKHVVSRKGAS